MMNWTYLTIMGEAYRQDMLQQAQQERLVRQLQQGNSHPRLQHKLRELIKLLGPRSFLELGNEMAQGRVG